MTILQLQIARNIGWRFHLVAVDWSNHRFQKAQELAYLLGDITCPKRFLNIPSFGNQPAECRNIHIGLNGFPDFLVSWDLSPPWFLGWLGVF